MRLAGVGRPLVALSMLFTLVFTVLISRAAPVDAAVVVEKTIMDGRLSWNTGGASRSIVAAPSPTGDITVWDRSTDTTFVIASGGADSLSVSGDLVVWADNGGENPATRCYNARTGETTVVVGQAVSDAVTDGRFVAYRHVDGDRYGGRCWDSLTGATRTIPVTGWFGLVYPDMRDGLLVWIDDYHEIAEGSDPPTGYITAWDAVTGRLTRITSSRSVVYNPKTDGRLVAWRTAGAAKFWDPAGGTRTVPEMSGYTLLLDHGVLVGSGPGYYSVREPSGSVRTVTVDSAHPYPEDYSDGLLAGSWQGEIRALDANTGVSDALVNPVTDPYEILSAADLVVTGTHSPPGPINLAQVARPVRIEGRSRFEVAVETAEEAYPRWQNVRDVVIACGDDRASADPLAAAGLCWRYDAPLLLVSSKQTSAAVRAAVREIVAVNGPITVHVVGGTASVPDSVVAQITAAAAPGTVTVDRVAGSDRYSLAASIAQRVADGHTGDLPAALVANGADSSKFFDAAALSAIAAAQGYPVLLVEKDRVPPVTASFIDQTNPDELIAAGGRATISDGVVTALDAERWAGADRYETAAVIATEATDPAREWLTADTCAIAAVLPDALTGGALSGHQGGPLLLSARSSLPAATADWLQANNGAIESAWVLGGADSVWTKVLSQASLRTYD